MPHRPWHSPPPPGMSGPPGRNYPVSKPSPAPPGEKGGGGYIEPKQEKKIYVEPKQEKKIAGPVEGLLSQPPEKKVITGTTEGPVGLGSPPPEVKKTKKKKSGFMWPDMNIRDIATKFGVPVSVAQLGYTSFGGRDPLKKENFSEKQLQYIKDQAIKNLKKGGYWHSKNPQVDRFGNLLENSEPVVFPTWAGVEFDITSGNSYYKRSVGNTLGDATAYMKDGELIITDYYDWGTKVGTHNPDTGKMPTTLSEWSYSVAKQAYLWATEGSTGEGDYYRHAIQGKIQGYEDYTIKEIIQDDAYAISEMFQDAVEALANIIGPQPYREALFSPLEREHKKISIFDVPENKRMVLNLGKVGE